MTEMDQRREVFAALVQPRCLGVAERVAPPPNALAPPPAEPVGWSHAFGATHNVWHKGTLLTL